MENTEIYETRDYGMFKLEESNRPVSKGHVKRLICSIQSNDLTNHYPILVTADLRVIDGQHRLKACQYLKIPIYYMISTTATISDMSLINANSKLWALDDYLNYYVSINSPEYVAVSDLCKKYKVNISVLIYAMSSISNMRRSSISESFKSGTYRLPTNYDVIDILEKCDEVISFIKSVRPSAQCPYVKTRPFYLALSSYLRNLKKGEYETFLKKLEVKTSYIKRCSTAGEYLECFDSVFNFCRKKFAKPLDRNNLLVREAMEN